MKIILLIVLFPIFNLYGQEQKIIRIHRDPITGKVWKKPVHRGQKSQTSRLSLSYTDTGLNFQ